MGMDIFVRNNDGMVAGQGEGAQKVKSGYVDGVSASKPSLYMERSGLAETGDKGPPRDKLWFTKAHSEFCLLPFLNLVIVGGPTRADFISEIPSLSPDQAIQHRKDWKGLKVWILVCNGDGRNLERANKYAMEQHNMESWQHLVDWFEGNSRTGLYLKITDLLDYGVDVALALQRPGDLVIGGPGLNHAVRAGLKGGLFSSCLCTFFDMKYLMRAYLLHPTGRPTR